MTTVKIWTVIFRFRIEMQKVVAGLSKIFFLNP